jgi:hypothetical protein
MLRMPLHPVAIELLRQTGPMAVSSATRHPRPAPATTPPPRRNASSATSPRIHTRRRALGGAGRLDRIVDLTVEPGAHPAAGTGEPPQAIAAVLGADAAGDRAEHPGCALRVQAPFGPSVRSAGSATWPRRRPPVLKAPPWEVVLVGLTGGDRLPPSPPEGCG